MPMAVTTSGTIIGLRIIALVSRASEGRALINPTAVKVPSAVARSAEAVAISRELSAEPIHSSDPKKFRYQARPKPGGGNIMILPEEKLMTMTTIEGAIRKIAIAPPRAQSHQAG